MTKINDTYDNLFLKVQKPGRYVGGEYNSYTDFDTKVRFALCFPDLYEVAISNLGNKIIYHMINESEKFSCERVYSPWKDMAELLREESLPLFTLETRTPLKELDIIGMSLSYEMCYTNMLDILNLSNIAIKSKDRTEADPIVFAGGVCAINPEPIADFLDFFVIGEGEENLFPVLELVEKKKDEGLSKQEFLKLVQELPYVYVPSFHEIVYDENGKFKELSPKKHIIKAVVEDFDNAYFPTNQIVANVEAVHDRGVLEVFRGCPRGCRFCQAGFTYRPIRARSKEKLVEGCKNMIVQTGYEEYSLSSLSTGDYPAVIPVLKDLQKVTDEKRVKMSLPSLRLDSFDQEILLQRRKMTAVTFAPEAGTQRLRDVINKNITVEEFEKALELAFNAGVKSVKLYFMIGLPTETDEDLTGIFEMAKSVKDIYRRIVKRKDVTVSVSVANFVPKPFTPFQWCAQDSLEEFKRKHIFLRELFHRSNINFRYHDPFVSKLEGIFALCGREAGALLEKAYEKGCNYDGWTEGVKKEMWQEAIDELNLDIDKMTSKKDLDKNLPWHMIDVGVYDTFFKREYQKAIEGEVTGDCLGYCLGCGASDLGECKKCW